LGNSKSAFPFTLASKDDQKIYSVDCAPKDFRLSDPDHLPTFKIEALYRHWLGRQRKGLKPFIVLSGNPHHQIFAKSKKSEKSKGKDKIRYVEISDEEKGDPDEEKQDQVDEGGNEEDEEDEDEKFEESGEEEEGGEDDKDDSSEEEQEEELDPEEEIGQLPKYGPPIGKAKVFPLVPVTEEIRGPIAGSSKLPPPRKPAPKKKNGNRWEGDEKASTSMPVIKKVCS
jgi:hypothetical protein